MSVAEHSDSRVESRCHFILKNDPMSLFGCCLHYFIGLSPAYRRISTCRTLHSPPILTMQQSAYLTLLALVLSACVRVVPAAEQDAATKQHEAASCPAASSQCEAAAALLTAVERLLCEVANLRREIQEQSNRQ